MYKQKKSLHPKVICNIFSLNRSRYNVAISCGIAAMIISDPSGQVSIFYISLKLFISSHNCRSEPFLLPICWKI